MNCGSTAVKIRMPFGFVAPTKKPSRTIRRRLLGATSLGPEDLRERLTVADVAQPEQHEVGGTGQLQRREHSVRSGPRSRRHRAKQAASCSANPLALPATVASAARRPSATPRLTTNRTLGPGIRIST